MMTLTAHEDDRTLKGSLRNLQKGWGVVKRPVMNPLTKKICHPKGLHGHLALINPFSDFKYLRVYEPHKNNALHAHFLTDYHPLDYHHPEHDFQPGSRLLKDLARSHGMGYEVQIKCIGRDPTKAVRYVTKYLTKNLAQLSGVRRIQTSGGFIVQDSKPQDFTWSQVPDFHLRHFSALYGEGREVFDVNLDRQITYDDFAKILWYDPETD